MTFCALLLTRCLRGLHVCLRPQRIPAQVPQPSRALLQPCQSNFTPIRFDMCLGARQPKVFSFFGWKQHCPNPVRHVSYQKLVPPWAKGCPLLSQMRNAHACTSGAICRACDPPRTLSLAHTRLRTSRLCGSVCSGRLPTPSPASSSSTRVLRREPVLRLCARIPHIRAFRAHAFARACSKH